MLGPSTPVQYVKGIGPRLAEILAVKGLHTVDDLLHYLPFRYEDRLNPRGIAELRVGEMATVIGEVRNSGLFRTRRMPIFQLTVSQGRSRLKCPDRNRHAIDDLCGRIGRRRCWELVQDTLDLTVGCHVLQLC